MHALSFSIRHLLSRSEGKNQKRVALQLLALSGVVRPGHVELRYPTTLISRPPIHAQRMTTQHPLTQSFPLQSWARTITFRLKQTWQWVSSLGMAPTAKTKIRGERQRYPRGLIKKEAI